MSPVFVKNKSRNVLLEDLSLFASEACLRFDVCCLNELHGFGPDTNDCGINSNASH